MIAASIWSLLIPAIEMCQNKGKIAWIPAVSGFLIGVISLMYLNKFVEHIEKRKYDKENKNSKETEINQKNSKKEINKKKIVKLLLSNVMLVIAVTLHNIPEGMAVGVSFAGTLVENAGITMSGAFALAIGIAIQNIPEGAIISMPLRSNGYSKWKSFVYGVLSGIVEPIGAVITILLTNIIVPVLPYLLSFAAGAMIYVVSAELIPEAETGEKKDIATIGIAVGFAIMMLLDITM